MCMKSVQDTLVSLTDDVVVVLERSRHDAEMNKVKRTIGERPLFFCIVEEEFAVRRKAMGLAVHV